MIENVAYNLGRNDEQPNIDLAVLLSDRKDREGIREIAEGLKSSKKQIANDCIKVLYEIGERTPELIADYIPDFIRLLKSSNNRLVWGSMTALAKVTCIKPQKVFENLDCILKAYKEGSVITIDNAISVFAELCKAGEQYECVVFTHIINHLKNCRPKEVCQHAERAFICVNKANSKEFAEALNIRKDVLNASQINRVNKLMRKIEQ